MRTITHTRPIAALLAATLFAAACSGGGDKTPTTPTPAITISTGAATLDITQGATATITVTVARSGGFAGDVAVTVEGLPAGVTASALTITSASTSGSITLTALATAIVAGSNLTVRGSGSGVTSVTASVALNVRVAAGTGAVSVTFNPTSLTITQGATSNVTATITRTGGFTGPVTLTVTGAPAGLTVVITPTASTNQTATVTTNSATLAFTASNTLAVGSINLTISASGTGVTTNTVTLATTVNAATGGSNNATWTFCPSFGIPAAVYVQDGTTAAFTRVTAGANNTYAFAITQSKGAVAYDLPQGTNGFQLFVFYGTQAEIQAQGTSICLNQGQTAKTITGTVVGLGQTDFASVSLGSAFAAVTFATNGAFTLNNVQNGALDLMASRTTFTINGSTVTTTLAAIVLRRALNLANNAVITPNIDLSATSTEAFAPVQRTLTVNGLNGEQALTSVSYITGSGSFSPLFSESTPSTTAARAFYTIPAAKQVAGDYHYAGAIAQSSFTATPATSRFAGTVFAASADKSVTLGPVPSAVTTSTLGTTPYVRLRGAIPIQPEYNKYLQVSWQQSGASPRFVTLQYTAGYVGAVTTLNADIPDLTAAGYTASHGMQAGVSTSLTSTVTGWSATGGTTFSPFVEGALYMSANRFLTLTP